MGGCSDAGRASLNLALLGSERSLGREKLTGAQGEQLTHGREPGRLVLGRGVQGWGFPGHECRPHDLSLLPL